MSTTTETDLERQLSFAHYHSGRASALEEASDNLAARAGHQFAAGSDDLAQFCRKIARELAEAARVERAKQAEYEHEN